MAVAPTAIALLMAALAKLAVTAAVSAAISIGAAFAFNALQPEPPTATIGEIDDTQRFTSEEGGPLNRCLGERCRVGGTVLWVGRLEKFNVREDIEGIRINKIQYQRDIAVAACLGPIEAIVRVFANGIQIHASIPELSVTSESFSVEVGLGVPGVIIIEGFGFDIGAIRIHQPKNDPFIVSTGFDVRDLFVGAILGMLGTPPDAPTGFEHLGNNIPGIITDTGTSEIGDPFIDAHPNEFPTGSFWVELISVLGAEEIHNSDRLITLKHEAVGFEQVGNLPYMDGIQAFLGTEDQEPSTWLNSPDGLFFDFSNLSFPGGGIQTQQAPCAPAYRGVAYVVISNLQLEQFGNQVPKIEFEIREKRNKSVGETLAQLLELGGLTSSDYVIDEAVDAIEMRGYVISGPTPMNKAIAPLLRAYNVVVQETNEGKLRFMKRDAGVVWTITEKDLAAHTGTEDIPRPFEITDVSDDTLPEQVNIDFIDPQLGLTKASQRERRINLTNRNIMKLDIPLTLNAGEARAVAARELWLSVINRQRVKLRLPPSYLRIKENDILLIESEGQDYRIVVARVERGNNFIMAIEGFLESNINMDLLGSPGEDVGIPDEPTGNALAVVVPIDKGGPFSSAHVGILGVYLAVINVSSNPFTGAEVFAVRGGPPNSDGSNLESVGNFTEDSDWGHAIDTPSLTAKPGVWDTESVINIKMVKGNLGSTTEDNVYKGVNWIRIGTEVLAYRDAVENSSKQFAISHLLRGLRDTADEIASHVTDPNSSPVLTEMVIPLRGDNFTFVAPMDNEIIGQNLYFGAAAEGSQSVTDIIWATPFVYFGHSGRSFRPNNLKIEKSGTSDSVNLTWNHKGTEHYGPFTTLTAPNFLPPGPHWRIEVYDVGLVLVRTVQRFVRFWLYNTTEQGEDGTSSEVVTFKIYEVTENGDSLVHIGTFDTT